MGILNQTEAEDIEAKATAIINRFFQQSIYEEFYEQIKVDCHERTPLRIDVRSGTYPRILASTFGQTRLSIPKQRRFFRAFIGDSVSHQTASRLLKTLAYPISLRNLLQNIRYKARYRRELMREAAHIYKANSRQEAIRRFRL